MPDAPPIVTTDGQECEPIEKWLAEFRRGTLARSLSLDLHALIAEVMMHEKNGSLTLTLKVEHVNSSQVQIKAETKCKPPEAAAPAALYYVDQMGRPVRHDPFQGVMFEENDSE